MYYMLNMHFMHVSPVHLYAKNMRNLCKNMQDMWAWKSYAEYAKICTPHFADVAGRGFFKPPRGNLSGVPTSFFEVFNFTDSFLIGMPKYK